MTTKVQTKVSTKKPTQTQSKNKPKTATFVQKAKRFLFKIFLWFNVLSLALVLLFKFVPVPFTPLMITRSIQQILQGKDIICKHNWVPLEDISTNLQKAVIASEDGRFVKHNGFDFGAMGKAFTGNLKGKKLKGGSTISQQTAKNVFLWQGRSYVRKILEAYYTILIELLWGKQRIMEVYLNSIEMGDGVYGAQAASQRWFHKSAQNLTKYEAASIAAILPSPRRYKAIGSSAYVEKRKNKIVRIMRNVGKINYQQ